MPSVRIMSLSRSPSAKHWQTEPGSGRQNPVLLGLAKRAMSVLDSNRRCPGGWQSHRVVCPISCASCRLPPP